MCPICRQTWHALPFVCKRIHFPKPTPVPMGTRPLRDSL